MSRYDFRLVHGDIGKTSVVRFLTIIRHCAAENSTPDHDRPLSSVGRAQAEQLRSWVSDPQALGAYGPTTCLVSAAARTRETYALGLAGTPFVRSLEISELIYNGSRAVTANDLVKALHDIDPVTESLSIVAHNPSVLDLAFELTEHWPVEIPVTCDVGSAVVIEIPHEQRLTLGKYRLVEVLHQPTL